MARIIAVFSRLLTRESLLIVTIWLLAVSCARADEPDADWSEARELAPGVLYEHAEQSTPRAMQINCLRIDSQTPRLKLYTTPRRADWQDGKAETNRETVRNFVRRSRNTAHPLVVAVNADAFAPWPAPYDQEEPTDLNGLSVSEGVLVSHANGTPSLIVTKSGGLRIDSLPANAGLSDVQLAVSGFALCLKEGQVLASDEVLHPRTGVGLSADHRYLYLLTIDGRQPASVGATVKEVGELLKDYGADTGINMDGGGSTTMAWWNPQASSEDKCELLNVPVGRGQKKGEPEPVEFSLSERANGNNLGVYFTKTDGQ